MLWLKMTPPTGILSINDSQKVFSQFLDKDAGVGWGVEVGPGMGNGHGHVNTVDSTKIVALGSEIAQFIERFLNEVKDQLSGAAAGIMGSKRNRWIRFPGPMPPGNGR